MEKRKIMKTGMTLMDAYVTMLESKVDKLEKQQSMLVEKEMLHVT